MEPPGRTGPDYLPPLEGKTAEQMTEWMAQNMPGKPEFLKGLCNGCGQSLEFPTELFRKTIDCPTCKQRTILMDYDYDSQVHNEFMRRMDLHEQREEEEDERRRKEFYVQRGFYWDACPQCGSLDYDIYEPSKPIVLSPMTFTGILVGGIANAMADGIFKPERVCRKCGHRYPIKD